jgi:hypothetical protein
MEKMEDKIMYNEEEKQEMKEMKDLLERIKRLEDEAKFYEGEAKEPMLINIEKFQARYDKKKEPLVAKFEKAKQEAQEQYETKVKEIQEKVIEENRKDEEEYEKKLVEYYDRIERLEEEKKIYSNDEQYTESIQNNIDRINNEIKELDATEGETIRNKALERNLKSNVEIELLKNNLENEINLAVKELEDVNVIVEPLDLGVKEKEENKDDEKDNDEKDNDEKDNDEKDNDEKDNDEKDNTGKENSPKGQSVKVMPVKKPNPRISIKYNAKTDEYVLIDKTNKGKKYTYKRSELGKINKEHIAQLKNVSIEYLENMNSDISIILGEYDKINGTNKLGQYYRKITKQYVSLNNNQTIIRNLTQDEMKEEMKKAKIDISYNLKGLYKKDKFSKEEISEILENANNAKQIGTGTVKKGFITFTREKIDNVINKMKNVKLLSSGSIEDKKEKSYVTKKSALVQDQYEKIEENETEKLNNQQEKEEFVDKTEINEIFEDEFVEKAEIKEEKSQPDTNSKKEAFRKEIKVEESELNKDDENESNKENELDKTENSIEYSQEGLKLMFGDMDNVAKKLLNNEEEKGRGR